MEDLLSSREILVIIWPIVFVLVQVISILLLKDRTIAKGDEKYRIWYKVAGINEPHNGPSTIDNIVKLRSQGTEITEIDRLENHFMDMFSFGPDLCITALATNLTAAFTIVYEEPKTARVLLSLSVLELMVLMSVLFLLKISIHRTSRASRLD